MELILKQDVKNLGYKDDVVSVKPGYGRNYLIPKGLAIQATDSAKKMLAEDLRQAQFKQEKIKADALEIANKLDGIQLSISARVGETGKIFGSVTALHIAEALKDKGFDIDRRRITIEGDLKTIGNYIANLNLHKEVRIKLPFEVTAQPA